MWLILDRLLSILGRGGRVVYGSSLENWRGRNVTVGSNPTLSAMTCGEVF